MKKGKNIDGNIKIFHKIPNFDADTNSIGINSLTDLQLEAYGYFDVVDNPITVYQRYGKLLPEHLINKKYITPIEDFTAQEVIDYDNQIAIQTSNALDNAEYSEIEENLRSAGERKFNRIRFRLRKKRENSTINANNFLKLRKDITPLILPLLQGDFDISKEMLDAFALTNPYANANQLAILTFAQQVVNNYIIKNNI